MLKQVLVLGLAAGIAWGPRGLAEELQSRKSVVRADDAFEEGQGAWGVGLHDRGAGASAVRLEARRIFDQSITRDLRLSEGRGGIELAFGELF